MLWGVVAPCYWHHFMVQQLQTTKVLVFILTNFGKTVDRFLHLSVFPYPSCMFQMHPSSFPSLFWEITNKCVLFIFFIFLNTQELCELVSFSINLLLLSPLWCHIIMWELTGEMQCSLSLCIYLHAGLNVCLWSYLRRWLQLVIFSSTGRMAHFGMLKIFLDNDC